MAHRTSGFEGRAAKCTLLVFIDDATSRLMRLLFVEAETTFNYFAAVRGYLLAHGKPVAFYSDKFSVFRVNIREAQTGTGLTQFGRAMQELGIELIYAHSPQAKGRVERANQTLQDRLTKELRLRSISTMEEANAFLPHYMDDYNRRFSVAPRQASDAHSPLAQGFSLDRMLCLTETRTLSRAPDILLQMHALPNQDEASGLHFAPRPCGGQRATGRHNPS